MSLVTQTIVLKSNLHFGKKVPPEAFGELLRILPRTITASIRMAFEASSQKKKSKRKWLSAASDIRFVDHDGVDETMLYFEAPRLGEAAEELYRQKTLWEILPKPEDTGFDLLGDVLKDVAAENADSDRFDRNLLQQIGRFRHGLNGTFQEMSFTGARFPEEAPAEVTPTIVERAIRLSNDTPPAQQTRIFGKLDMIRSSTSTFAIKLDDGTDVPGVLLQGSVSTIRDLVDQDVLVLGKAVYRPSGKLLRIDASTVQAAQEADRFFSKVPPPKRHRFSLSETIHPQRQKKGISAVFGKWPGDETDEEILAALEDLG